MATSGLRIKLKVTAPKPLSSADATPASSTANSPMALDRKPPSDLPPAKRPRSRPKPRKPMLVDNSTNEVASNDEQGSILSRPSSTQPKASYRILNLTAHKGIPVRKWKRQPLEFYTIGGGKVEIPVGCWQTDERMHLNTRSTEPTTPGEVDKLFSNDKDFRPFLCTHAGCNKSFTNFEQLQTHENNMHGQKKNVCGIDGCQKSFATSGQLTKHRKMVHFREHRKKKLLAEAEAAAGSAGGDDDTSTAANTPILPLANDDDDVQSISASTHDSPGV
ncbi:hypothetical protein DM01DRAFT_1332471 [Hesseltinella vesiculosa]|uniref:C2H2-type domain-containing protein n=1 Tax=Hesseltinella vesiculosa TaxID=101127 RepID=A0A1X2GS71_9FUNG|nr:hypothetical protein DM01DRAFT_1332471 [Hesseltinella vesiculosa]